MHILMVCESFHPQERGGAGRVAGDVCRELHRRGHKLDVLSPSAALAIESNDLAPGLSLHKLPAGEGPLAKQIDFSYTPRMAAEALEYLRGKFDLDSVDVFHDNGAFFQTLLPLEFLLLDSMPRAKSIVQFQIQYRPLFAMEPSVPPHAAEYIDKQRQLARRADIVAFLSREERDEGVANFGLDVQKVQIVPNAIAMERYAGLESCVPLWEMPQPPKIALAGRLGSAMKGLDLALRALATIADKQSFDVLLIGHQPSVNEIPAPLQGRVHATGWLDARGVAEALHGCAAFLMPSRYEPFGILALEAHAVMCPVIATNTGGLRDIVINGETGLLCDPKDPGQDIAEHVRTLLRDNDLREDLAIAARARLEATYTLGALCDKLESLYTA